MEVFTFMIPDTEGKKVTETSSMRIELYNEYLVMTEDYYADFTNEALGTTENKLRKHTDYHIRSRITGCHKHWYCKTKVWGVEINLMGATDNLHPCFKRESQAQEFCEALLKWLLK